MLLAVVLCFGMAGCGGGETEEPAEAETEAPDKVSSILKDWDLQVSDEEALAMSNFMAVGEYIVVEDLLYGSFGGEAFGQGTFSVGTIEDGDMADVVDRKVIEEDSAASYLTEHDGSIYGILNWDKIVKVEIGKAKAETIYEGPCDYLQIIDGKIYFTDESYKLCSMDLSGGDVKTVIDQADMYYVYVLPNNHVVYQNDPDGESLHVYNLKTGEDVKLNSVVSHHPILHGDHLYYTTPAGAEETYSFQRIDLYTGEIETAPYELDNTEFMIENGKFVFGTGGLPTVEVEKFSQLDLSGYSGLVSEGRYSNGKIRVISDTATAEIYITNKPFQEGGKTSIGYNYIAQ